MSEQNDTETGQTVQDSPGLLKKKPYIEVARDSEGRWHWCLWTPNGRAMATDVTGYGEVNDCTRAIETFKETMRTNAIQVVIQHAEE